MSTPNKRFSIKFYPESEIFKTNNPNCVSNAWDVMVDDLILETFFTENAAKQYFFEQLTIPGINSVFQKRRKFINGQIRELQALLKNLDSDRKTAIKKRDELLRRPK